MCCAMAFSCDLCDTLEGGATAQKLAVAPSMGKAESLELCSACLLSFNDWRISRAPQGDQPGGAYQ